jgi:pimeloyl-ACP methyl ester carboxylesterase
MKVLVFALLGLFFISGDTRPPDGERSSLRVAYIGGDPPGAGVPDAQSDSVESRKLGELLGPGFEFRLFDRNELPAVTAWRPGIVLIDPARWTTDRIAATVSGLGNLTPVPRIILLLPVPGFPPDTAAENRLMAGTIPRIRSVAYAEGCEVVDIHSPFLANNGPDYGLPRRSAHPAEVIASRLRDVLLTRSERGIDIARVAGSEAAKSSYFGYECYDFRFNGREAKIVRPKRTAAGRPWIWRARFWGHEPQTEIALLERGFHVAFCDVAELFGNDEAIATWDRFYDLLTGAGLSKKPALEGLSRGGMYIYRWAAHSPSRVSCVYADAPVLDMKSWPGGKGKGGGNPVEWQRFKDDFGLASEEAALAFRGNPLDMTVEIARGGFPMLHVCGTADPVVPIEENTDPFEKKILESGGRITVIRKPGIGHHPHSLPDPGPIVTFILDATAPPGGR